MTDNRGIYQSLDKTRHKRAIVTHLPSRPWFPAHRHQRGKPANAKSAFHISSKFLMRDASWNPCVTRKPGNLMNRTLDSFTAVGGRNPAVLPFLPSPAETVPIRTMRSYSPPSPVHMFLWKSTHAFMHVLCACMCPYSTEVFG